MNFNKIKRKVSIATKTHLKLKRLSTWNSEDYRTSQILKTLEFSKVIDIGANEGQFSEPLIDFGFRGEIISFEPTSYAYNKLSKKVSKYKKWKLAEKCAIGDFDGYVDINVSKNSVFSSIKTVSPEHATYYKDSSVIEKERVKIFRLDSLQGKHFNDDETIFLKIDTQGFEEEVLKGANESLQYIQGVKIEIPLQPIYEKVTWNIFEIFDFFNKKGFECVSLAEVAVNRNTGIVNEADSIFIKKEFLQNRR